MLKGQNVGGGGPRVTPTKEAQRSRAHLRISEILLANKTEKWAKVIKFPDIKPE